MKSIKHRLIATIAASLTVPAFSQSLPSEGDQQLAMAESQTESGGMKRRSGAMEEIIVTATRRAESLLEVPISIAVVTADDIDRRGLVSSEDYLRGIPGVAQASDQYGQSIVIRGIETFPAFQNYFGAATVATYFGETPMTASGALSGSTSADAKLVDIERVEVLRGPQGTAFGNASLGGAVRTIPMAPKLGALEAKVGGGYSVTSGTGGDNYTMEGVVNIPLINDQVAVRAVGYRYEEEGFYRNVSGTDAAFRARAADFGAESFAANRDGVGDYYVIGGRISALYQASEDLKFTLTYQRQESETDGFAATNTGAFGQLSLQVAPEHADGERNLGLFDNVLNVANAVMEYDIGWGDLVATYSYLKSDSTYVYPLGIYTPVGSPYQAMPVSWRSPSGHRGNIGEIRLATKLEGAWNFLAGVYGEDLDDVAIFRPYWSGSAEANLFAPGQSGSMGGLDTDRNLKQKAAFAEVSWEFLPGLTITGGGRAYQYDRSELTSSTGAVYGELSPTLYDADASGTSFRGNLSYKPNENALVYAGWSQGFRLGRAQTGLNAATCDVDGDGLVDGTSNVTIDSTKVVNSDEVDNYELGGKFVLLNRRLTIAADLFRIDWTDVPVTRNLAAEGAPVPATCYPAYTANAGVARSEGMELELNFYATEALRIDAGGSWIRAELTRDVPAINAFEGARLPASPEFNANLGLQYEFNVGRYQAFVRADPIYVGTFYGNLQETANTKAGGYVKVDLSGRVDFGSLDVDLFVRNLTNEDEFSFRTPEGVFGYRLRPRTIGFRLNYDF
ncbi:TonB-dependent receptor [Steroidobacter sp. S1-65]|uniref:TonB-dependent receptor n=1 Tax=Steroidobacter gossypii TaxID=2805490 RepID=A0ABS1X6Q0_9GAMM|nr:TonB-dependent receptor [Steroidobacter gossypii]MBM0108903.1 TonB-dependent receptor [Steroidobacter gossypii]